MDYHIIKISRNKKQYLNLLLLGDEQETMIDRYLERGDLFVLEDNGIKAVGVVTKEGPEICVLIFDGIFSHFDMALKLNAKLGFWGLVILICWQQIGYMMIVYIAGLQAIPDSLKEAAMIDGANAWKRLFHVTIPNMMPSITICTFLTITNSFKLFDQNLSLTGGEPLHKTEMLALNIYDTFYGRVGYEGVGQAKAVIFFLAVIVISMLQLRLTRSKEVQQ